MPKGTSKERNIDTRQNITNGRHKEDIAGKENPISAKAVYWGKDILSVGRFQSKKLAPLINHLLMGAQKWTVKQLDAQEFSKLLVPQKREIRLTHNSFLYQLEEKAMERMVYNGLDPSFIFDDAAKIQMQEMWDNTTGANAEARELKKNFGFSRSQIEAFRQRRPDWNVRKRPRKDDDWGRDE